MKLSILPLLLCCAAFAQLPDAPKPQRDYSEGPRFFQFRAGPEAKPATNRQVFKSKVFWLQAGFMFAAEELARTRTHSESEPWAAAGVMGFSYLGYRFFSPCFTIGMTGSGANWLKEWKQAK